MIAFTIERMRIDNILPMFSISNFNEGRGLYADKIFINTIIFN